MIPAAKLAVGYLLDELKNDITRETPARPVRESRARFKASASVLSHGASFEPSIYCVVTKIPRFAFEVLAHGHHSARSLQTATTHAHHADEKRGRSLRMNSRRLSGRHVAILNLVQINASEHRQFVAQT